MLIGVRVTLDQIVGLGSMTFVAVAFIVITTLAVGVAAGWPMGLSTPFGVIEGGSVAICGASAELALATTMGERHVHHAQLALVLVGGSASSATAMFFYPLIAHQVSLSNRQVGLCWKRRFKMSRRRSAGYAFSGSAGEVATNVKLIRVALFAPMLIASARSVLRFGGTGLACRSAVISERRCAEDSASSPWRCVQARIRHGNGGRCQLPSSRRQRFHRPNAAYRRRLDQPPPR